MCICPTTMVLACSGHAAWTDMYAVVFWAWFAGSSITCGAVAGEKQDIKHREPGSHDKVATDISPKQQVGCVRCIE